MPNAQFLRALSNEKRLSILGWLRDPTRHFPPQTDGTWSQTESAVSIIAEKARCEPVRPAERAPTGAHPGRPLAIEADQAVDVLQTRRATHSPRSRKFSLHCSDAEGLGRDPCGLSIMRPRTFAVLLPLMLLIFAQPANAQSPGRDADARRSWAAPGERRRSDGRKHRVPPKHQTTVQLHRNARRRTGELRLARDRHQRGRCTTRSASASIRTTRETTST